MFALIRRDPLVRSAYVKWCMVAALAATVTEGLRILLATASDGRLPGPLASATLVTATLWLPLALFLLFSRASERCTRMDVGHECNGDAKVVFKERCPDLGLDELKTAEYQAERLWTLKSISLTRIALVFAWSLTFAALSSALGVFLVYQMRSKTNKS